MPEKAKKTAALTKTKKAVAAKPAVAAKSAKKAEPKVKLAIVDKKSAKLEIKATELKAGEATDEDEEELEATSSSSSGAASAGLAMAAVSADSAASSLKNFRHHPDIENFYRFIYENDLRYEALEIIDLIATQRETTQAVRAAKAKSH